MMFLFAHITLLFVPLWVLSKYELRLSWWMRYVIASLPAGYTGLGWQLAGLTADILHCPPQTKDYAACYWGQIDLSGWINYGIFLMIPLLVAIPITLWLLLDTALKQMGSWHRRQLP